jgi:two-component system, LytTR family, sensor kinase
MDHVNAATSRRIPATGTFHGAPPREYNGCVSISLQRLQQFWPLQILGWSVYTGGIFVSMIGRFREAQVIAYNLVFLGSMLAASFVLRVICRRLFSGTAGLPRAMFKAALWSGVCAVPCGIIPEWAAAIAGEDSFNRMALLRAWGPVVYSAVVLTAWSGLYLGIKHYRFFEAERERARQAEALARRARLQALQLQLHPHFLFNTLNAISTLIVECRSAAANHMLGQLAAFLRVTLNDLAAPEIPLSREVSNIKVYLDIEKARLGERLEVKFSIAPDVEGAMVPALLLQPLAENAIRHGITPRLEGGKLTIEAERAGTRLQVRVCDNGVGAGLRTAQRGLGLANTIERLRVLYGNDHRLAVRWPDEGGCVVDVEMPYSTSDIVVAHEQ